MRNSPGMDRMLILLLLSLAQMLASSLLLTYLSMENWSAVLAEDSDGYILAARFFAGSDIPDPSLPLLRYRLFSPLVPFLAALLGRIMPLTHAFLVLNCISWISAVYVVHRLSAVLISPPMAYSCSLLFTSSLPLIVWGLPIMVDMGSFLMAAINCLLIIQPPRKKPLRLLVALTLPLAILTKPNLVCLVIFFLLYAGLRKEYAKIAVVGAVTSLLVGGVYFSLGLSLQDFLTFGYLRHRGLIYVINALIVCFHWGIPLGIWGFGAEKRHRDFYLTYLASTFGCYLAFVHNPRLLFIIFPAALPLVARGIALGAERAAERWRLQPRPLLTALITCYMLTSNILAAVYLYITRVLQYRSIETLGNLLG